MSVCVYCTCASERERASIFDGGEERTSEIRKGSEREVRCFICHLQTPPSFPSSSLSPDRQPPPATPFNNNNNRAGLAAVGRRRGMWTGGGRQREGGKRRRGRSGVGGRVWVTRRPCHVRFQPQPTSSTGPPRVSTSLRDVGVSSGMQVHLALRREIRRRLPKMYYRLCDFTIIFISPSVAH